MKKRAGKIFVLSGPSGSGKTTLYHRLQKDKSVDLSRSISCTTRLPRREEKHGRDYFFISRGEFLNKQRRGEFLETQTVFNNLYGTPLKPIRQAMAKKTSMLLCVDVKGAQVVKRKFPQAVMIFLIPPSLEILSSRLDKRSSEDKFTKALRLRIAKKELTYQKFYDYVVINDKIERALQQIKEIIHTEQNA